MKDKFKTINNLSNKINNITEKFNGLNYNKTSKKLKYFNYKLMDIDFNNLIEKQNNIVNSINKTSDILELSNKNIDKLKNYKTNLKKNISKCNNIFDGAKDDIQFCTNFIYDIDKKLKIISNEEDDDIKEHFNLNSIADSIVGAFNSFVNVVKGLVNSITDGLNKVIRELSNIGNKIGSVFEKIFKDLFSTMIDVFKMIYSFFEKVWNVIKEYVPKIIEFTKNAFTKIIAFAKKFKENFIRCVRGIHGFILIIYIIISLIFSHIFGLKNVSSLLTIFFAIFLAYYIMFFHLEIMINFEDGLMNFIIKLFNNPISRLILNISSEEKFINTGNSDDFMNWAKKNSVKALVFLIILTLILKVIFITIPWFFISNYTRKFLKRKFNFN